MTLKPRIFMSYARRDEVFVRKVAADLQGAGLDVWIDRVGLEAGDSLDDIQESITECTFFFAYVTKNYLASRWCRKEFDAAFASDRLLVGPFADSQDTIRQLPVEIADRVAVGLLADDDTYVSTLLQIARKASDSLQVTERLVPAEDHILAGPSIFDSVGFRRRDLIDRTDELLVLAAANLRSWLSDKADRDLLVALVRSGKRVKLILATYESLGSISPEGEIHLRQSVRDIQGMNEQLSPPERERLEVYFHVGAATLSAVFIDPETPGGILLFSPRWAIQFVPQDRLTCVIDKRINDEGLYKALYNGVLLMTQGDARSLAYMVANL